MICAPFSSPIVPFRNEDPKGIDDCTFRFAFGRYTFARNRCEGQRSFCLAELRPTLCDVDHSGSV